MCQTCVCIRQSNFVHIHKTKKCFDILLSLLAFPYNHSCSHSLISVSLISQSSSDSESSTQSNVGTLPQTTAGFAAVRSAEDRLSEHLQRVIGIPLDSSVSLHTPLEDGVNPIAIKEESKPQHTPSPQSASQCLHTYSSHAAHNDIELESNSYTTLRSSDEWKLQSQITNRESKNGLGKGTLGIDKEVRGEDVHPESEINVPLSIPEVAHTVVREKRELPTGLELDSALVHKPHLFNSHHTPLKLQQNITLRPHTPASDSSRYPELWTGLHANHSDCPNSSREVLLPVSSTSKEQHVSVPSDTNLSKDRNADQGQIKGMVSGYSQMTSRYPQAFTPPQRLAGPSRPSAVKTAGEWFKKRFYYYFCLLVRHVITV